MKFFKAVIDRFYEYLSGVGLLLQSAVVVEPAPEYDDGYTATSVIWRDSINSTYAKIHFPCGGEYVCKFHHQSKDTLLPDRVYLLQYAKGFVYILTPRGKITFCWTETGHPELVGQAVIGTKYKRRRGISPGVVTSKEIYQSFVDDVLKTEGLCAMIKVLNKEDANP